jgi:hypothetical protein
VREEPRQIQRLIYSTCPKTYRFPETEEQHLIKGLDELIELGLIEQTNAEEGKQSYKILVNPFQD